LQRLKLPDRRTLAPFKWQKTPQGATAYLEKLTEGLTETNPLPVGFQAPCEH